MRYSLVLAAALAGFAAPAFAQDRTIPAGALDAVQAPIDRNIGFEALVPAPMPRFEGRSASERPVRAHRSHHQD